MTIDEAIEISKAKLKCYELSTTGRYGFCGGRRCDDCEYSYQGDMDKEEAWFKMATKALEFQKEHEQVPCSEKTEI